MPYTSPTAISVGFHSTLRVTPAIMAGITDYVWSIDELLLGQMRC
jgi:hypothetical protein